MREFRRLISPLKAGENGVKRLVGRKCELRTKSLIEAVVSSVSVCELQQHLKYR